MFNIQTNQKEWNVVVEKLQNTQDGLFGVSQLFIEWGRDIRLPVDWLIELSGERSEYRIPHEVETYLQEVTLGGKVWFDIRTEVKYVSPRTETQRATIYSFAEGVTNAGTGFFYPTRFLNQKAEVDPEGYCLVELRGKVELGTMVCILNSAALPNGIRSISDFNMKVKKYVLTLKTLPAGVKLACVSHKTRKYPTPEVFEIKTGTSHVAYIGAHTSEPVCGKYWWGKWFPVDADWNMDYVEAFETRPFDKFAYTIIGGQGPRAMGWTEYWASL